MAISIEQITAWMNHGPTQNAINSHSSIRATIGDLKLPPGYSTEVFLQGSYKNYTNIRGDGDVDVVILLRNVFFHNLDEEQARQAGIISSEYGWTQFNDKVTDSLIHRYGAANTNVGKKAIRVIFNSSNYCPADVVVAVPYRKYQSISKYDEGIAFLDRNSRQLIINYPKQHFVNGNRKSESTNGLFRNYVRLLKRARNNIKDNLVPPGADAPSYFIESLVYNLRDEVIKQDPRTFIAAAVNHWEYANQQGDRCQNEMVPMYGSDSTTWSHQQKIQFSVCLRNLFGV